MVNRSYPLVVIREPREHGFVPPIALFQRGHAGLFTPVDNVRDVNTSMSALNVVPNIPPVNVRSPQPTSSDLTLAKPDRPLVLKALHSQPVTPVKADRFEYLLTGYNPVLQNFSLDGFRHGFRIYFIGDLTPFEYPNLQSVLHSPEVVSTKLMKEIDAGRVVGPFSATPNDFRLIHHLSYPKGSSVNDSIPDDCASVHYATISDAVNILKSLGTGCYMAKTDIKSAFRIIPVHPLDYPLLGIKWDNQYYFYRCLAMGLKSSCAIFEKFSSSLE